MSDLPNGWTTVALGDVTSKASKWDPRSSGKFIDYIDIASIDTDAKRIVSKKQVHGADAPSRARQLVQSNDVLVSTVRPNLNGIAIVPEHLEGATASTGFSVLRSTPGLEPRFLGHWVSTRDFVSQLVQQATGQSYPAVSDKIVRETKLPLPPLNEQRRIAAILDSAHTLLNSAQASTERLRASLRPLHASVLSANETKLRTLQEASAAVIDCPHSTPRWREEGVTCLRTSNLGYGEWLWSDHRFIDEAQHTQRTKQAELLAGDIVLSREGTIGVMAMVPAGLRASLGQRLVQVRPASNVNGRFLLESLLTELQPGRVEHKMIGATAKRINVKTLKTLTLRLPAKEVQDRFAHQATQIDELSKRMRLREAAARNLVKALASRAFRGEL